MTATFKIVYGVRKIERKSRKIERTHSEISRKVRIYIVLWLHCDAGNFYKINVWSNWSSGILGQLAEKIAEKHGVELTIYDFSGGRWDEPRDYRSVFSVILPDDESKFEKMVIKLYEAKKELREATDLLLNRILETKLFHLN